jgi:hypothetical protein
MNQNVFPSTIHILYRQTTIKLKEFPLLSENSSPKMILVEY